MNKDSSSLYRPSFPSFAFVVIPTTSGGTPAALSPLTGLAFCSNVIPTARAVGYVLAPLRGFSKCRWSIGDIRAQKWPISTLPSGVFDYRYPAIATNTRRDGLTLASLIKA